MHISKTDALNFIDLVANNFELILAIVASYAILLGIIYVLAKLRTAHIPAAKVKSFLTEVVPNILLLILVGLCVLLEYVYWRNYSSVTDNIAGVEDQGYITTYSDTSWIKDTVQLFYVNGNEMRSVLLNGQNDRAMFKLDEPIKEYSFSPDKRSILALTPNALYLVIPAEKTVRKIESLFPPEQRISPDFRGSISGCQWSPDGSRFVYEVYRWSKFTNQYAAYIYDIAAAVKQPIKNPTRKLSSLYWDRPGDNLYYFFFEERDTSLYDHPYDIKVFRVPVATCEPEFFREIPFDKRDLPWELLWEKGIDIPRNGTTVLFRGTNPDILVSEFGQRVGIDTNDFFYYVPNQWFKRRFFRIPRRANPASQRYAYKGGDLLIDQVCWLPGGKYVLLRHRDWGMLVFEPKTGRLGLLGLKGVTNLGWVS